MSNRHIVGVALFTEYSKLYSLPSPNRHGDVIAYMLLGGLSRGQIARAQQGFVTDEGTFVDRVQAMQIAKAAGQIRTTRIVDGIERTHEPTGRELYSEDLW